MIVRMFKFTLFLILCGVTGLMIAASWDWLYFSPKITPKYPVLFMIIGVTLRVITSKETPTLHGKHLILSEMIWIAGKWSIIFLAVFVVAWMIHLLR